jgi:hypothetical protein
MSPVRKAVLEPVTGRDLERASGLGRATRVKADFPKASLGSNADVKAKVKAWVKSQKEPPAPRPTKFNVKAVRLNANHVALLARIHESEAPTAEMVAAKLPPEEIVGVVYSSVATLEYTKLEGEYKKRLADAGAGGAARVEAQWRKVVEAAQAAHKAGGLSRVSEADLSKFSQELRRNQRNFDAVVNIANTGKSTQALDSAPSRVTAAFLPFVGILFDPSLIIIPTLADLCARPIEGKFTKHFSRSFSLSVTISVWCPTWTNPFRFCDKTFTLAGVSLSLDLEVGYRVTCCGATAWGYAAVQACATIIGISVCASCSAKVTGVAGVGRGGSGSSCTYGLGINAQLECKFAGATIFSFNVPFGWTVTGPCPPAVLPC